VVKRNYWAPHEKATYLMAALNEPDAHMLHGVHTTVTYKEVTYGLQNRYCEHHLEAAFQPQLKTSTQLVVESLQEFVAATDHLAQCAHTEWPKHLIGKEAARAFVEGKGTIRGDSYSCRVRRHSLQLGPRAGVSN
jgi:hypothetical protein